MLRAAQRTAARRALAISEFINGALRAGPWRVSKPLHDGLEGFRGARRGEYRLVVRTDEEERVVRVVRVDHRSASTIQRDLARGASDGASATWLPQPAAIAAGLPVQIACSMAAWLASSPPGPSTGAASP